MIRFRDLLPAELRDGSYVNSYTLLEIEQLWAGMREVWTSHTAGPLATTSWPRVALQRADRSGAAGGATTMASPGYVRRSGLLRNSPHLFPFPYAHHTTPYG